MGNALLACGLTSLSKTWNSLLQAFQRTVGFREKGGMFVHGSDVSAHN